MKREYKKREGEVGRGRERHGGEHTFHTRTSSMYPRKYCPVKYPVGVVR